MFLTSILHYLLVFAFFVYALHVVVVARRHHVVVMVIHFAALAFRPFASALASTFLVERLVQLNFGVLINIPQILSDTVVSTQVLFSKVDCFLVRQDGCGVALQKFLLDSHVVVGNC